MCAYTHMRRHIYAIKGKDARLRNNKTVRHIIIVPTIANNNYEERLIKSNNPTRL